MLESNLLPRHRHDDSERVALDWLDDHDDVDSSSPQLTVASAAQRWPVLAVLGVSAAGLVVSLFASPWLSSIAYAVLLVVGCGLLFYRRYDAIATTRSAGGVGAVSVQRVEKIAIAALATACLANGIVIALDVASWAMWPRLWRSIL